MVETVRQTDTVGQLHAPVHLLRTHSPTVPLVLQWDRDVLEDGELRNQVVRLENETDHLVADRRKIVVRQRRRVLASKEVLAMSRPVQGAENVQQGALATARCTHDRDEVSPRKLGRHATQCLHHNRTQVVMLVEINNLGRTLHPAPLPMAPPRGRIQLKPSTLAARPRTRTATQSADATTSNRNNDGRNRPGHAGPLAPRFLLQHHTARSTL